MKINLFIKVNSIILVLIGITAANGAITLKHDQSGNLTQITTTVAAKPVITTQPADWLGLPGSTAVFSVTASSSLPVTYQWLKGKVKLVGATGSTLSVLNAATALEDGYSVEVKNARGIVVSRAARLWIDSDTDGMADSVERKSFGDLGEDPEDDFDRDGVSNANEIADGTNPALNSSRFFSLVGNGVHGLVNVIPTSVTGRYAPGTKVKLTPVPEAGHQFVEWQGTYQSLAPVLNFVMNQNVTQTAVFGSPLGLALDAPQLNWQTGGAGSWTGQRMITHDTKAAGQSPNLTVQGQSFVSTYVEGPATVTFWWRQPATSTATLSLFVNGTLNSSATKGSWVQRTVSLNQGVHLLNWILTQPAGVTTDAQGWLDEVRVSTHPAIPLAQALETPTFTYATDRMNPWYGTIAGSQDGVDCAVGTVNGQYRTSWIETRVPGPGTLNFWWRTFGSGTGMRVYVDGSQQLTQNSTTWTNSNLNIVGTGPHIITWEVHTQDDAYALIEYGIGHLDKLTWSPATTVAGPVVLPPVPPTVALDNNAFAWAAGGSKPWVPTITSGTTYDGVDAMMSGVIGHRQDSWIETKVMGPGNLTFRWRVSSALGDQLTVLLDGAVQRMIEGSVSYTQVTQAIPVGFHTVRWRYAKNTKDVAGNDRAYLDSVSFASTSAPSPPSPPTLSGPPVPELAVAVDQTSLSFATGGNQPFAATTTTTHDGTDAATNGDIGASQEAWMETILSGTGTLSFWWKVSSEGGYDYLRVLIDGVEMNRISGEVDWQQMNYPISTSGLHVVRWRYSKDGSVDSGMDSAWVDQVTWSGASGGTGGGSTYAIAPNPLRLPPTGGTFPLVMVGSGAWTASETASWLTFSTASGVGNATLQATVTAQTGGAARQTIANIAGQNVTIIQEGFQKPVLGSYITNATLLVGDVFNASMVSYNFPTKYAAAGLPSGLAINPTTGAISGNVSKAGIYTVNITASNPGGVSAPAQIKITVLLPVFVDGVYTGLIPPNTLLNSDLGGLATLTLSKTGGITGTVKMGAISTPVTGSVIVTAGGGARLQTNLLRKGTSALAIDLSFDPGRLMGSASGTLRDTASSTSSVPLVMWKNLWSVATNPATSYQGLYNNFMGIEEDHLGDPAVPQGDGFMTMNVTSAGGVTYGGKLADGTGVTGSSTLWATGEAPFYSSLYANTGGVQGVIGIDGVKQVSARLDWVRKPQTKATERNYKAGFGPLVLSLVGGSYMPPSVGNIVLGLPDRANNALMVFSGGDVETSSRFGALDQVFRITKTNTAQFTAATNPAGVTLTIVPATGKLNGSFTLRDPDISTGVLRKVTFEGLLVPRLGGGRGFFLLNGLSPTLTTSSILSGQMSLGAAP